MNSSIVASSIAGKTAGSMTATKRMKVRTWREGECVIIRSDELHVTTYGKNMREALKNFNEARLVGI